MASKFDKAKGAQSIKEVAQTSNAEANVITIKYYKDEDLLDYPKNNEDITNTADIEKSIEEQGFTDPIEITDFGTEDGKFTIVSGHRRRMAGRKMGIKKFPCILRHFKSDSEVHNYVLFGNAQRPTTPVLLAKRYKMHEEYLKEIGFKGSKREEIARRMNLRVAQADRYNQLNKVIFPLLDMVDKEVIGISHVTDSGLYTHAPEEQEEILQIINECLDNGVELTRPVAKKIVDSYREGKRTWLEVIQLDLKDMENNAAFGTGVSVMNVNTEPQESKEDETSPLRNEEINYDYSHREGLAENDQYKEERLDADDYAAIEKAANNGKEKEEKPPLTPQEKKLLAGEKVLKSMEHLESAANEIYEFESAEKAQLAVKTMESIIKVLLAEMEAVADKNDFLDSFNESLKSIIKEAEQYKE